MGLTVKELGHLKNFIISKQNKYLSVPRLIYCSNVMMSAKGRDIPVAEKSV